MDRLKRRYVRHDEFGLLVRGTKGDRAVTISIAGHHQATVTAVAAAEFARMLAEGVPQRAGIWFPEQVFDPDRFFTSLASAGWSTVTSSSA